MIVKTDLFDDLDVNEQLEFIEALADHMDESIMITLAAEGNDNPPIIYVNKAFTELTGYSLGEVLGKTPRILHGRQTERAVPGRLQAEAAHALPFRGRTVNYRKDGAPFLMEWQIVPFLDQRGHQRFHLTVQRDAKGN